MALLTANFTQKSPWGGKYWQVIGTVDAGGTDDYFATGLDDVLVVVGSPEAVDGMNIVPNSDDGTAGSNKGFVQIVGDGGAVVVSFKAIGTGTGKQIGTQQFTQP